MTREREAFEAALKRHHDVLGTIEAALQEWDEFHQRYPEPFNSFWVAFQEGWKARGLLVDVQL